MAANLDPLFAVNANISGFQFLNATSTTEETLFTAGTNGSKVRSISVCSSDTSAQDLAIFINNGTTDFYLGNIHVTIGAGFTTVAKLEGITILMPTGVPYIWLPTGYLLKGKMVAAVTSAKEIDVLVIGENF